MTDFLSWTVFVCYYMKLRVNAFEVSLYYYVTPHAIASDAIASFRIDYQQQ